MAVTHHGAYIGIYRVKFTFSYSGGFSVLNFEIPFALNAITGKC